MEHAHAGQESKLDGLLGEGVGTRYDGLRGDDGRHRGKRHHGIVSPSGGKQIERIGDRARVGQEQRALSEIVQDKAGQNDGEPAEADRRPTEMTHIGVHRLTAGDGQEGGAEHGKTDGRFRVEEVAQRAERAERGQDGGCTKDPEEAEDADDGEPQQHRRSEDVADETGALALNEKQPNQDQDADRHDASVPVVARRLLVLPLRSARRLPA